jgi:hypothetical protein
MLVGEGLVPQPVREVMLQHFSLVVAQLQMHVLYSRPPVGLEALNSLQFLLSYD